jgi:hypothetical protein
MADDVCAALEAALRNNTPLFIGRNGSTESEVILGSPIQVYEPYLECAGIWNEHVAYVEAAAAATLATDLIASQWFEPVVERERVFLGNRPQTRLECLDPTLNPYTRLFADQSVSVISPFAATMAAQHQRNPQFAALHTIRTGFAPRIAGSNAACRWPSHIRSWRQAVDYVVDQVDPNCRVVLIGCGALGMLIAHKLHMRGKHIVIVVGGVLQLLFKIKGRRWRTRTTDDTWTSPSRDETPAAKNMIEAGCYWWGSCA